MVYHFNPKNHTVTQSSFASPCGPKDGGLDSGLYVLAVVFLVLMLIFGYSHPVTVNQTTDIPTFTVLVNDVRLFNSILIYTI